MVDGTLPSPVSASSAPAPRGWPVVLMIAVLMAMSPLTMDMYLPSLPVLADDFAASPAQIQLSLTGVLIGLAAGQLVVGPLADAFGRRRPVLIGLTIHIVASLACALATSAEMLAGIRLLQGLSLAAVSVVCFATLRDLFAGGDYARVMSRMFLILGMAPVIAPAIGTAVLVATSWRWIFVALAIVGAILLVTASIAFPETLAPENRRSARPRATLGTYRDLLRDTHYTALVLVGAMMFSMMFSYIAGSSFVLQDGYGLSAGQYSAVLAANGALLAAVAQCNPLLIRRFGPARVLACATVTGVTASLLLVAALSVGTPSLPLLLGLLAVPVGVYGLSMPNSQGLALNGQGARAGSAAAIMGFAQFVVASIVAPLGGLGGVDGVLMASMMAGVSAVAAATMLLVVRRHTDSMQVR